MINKKLPRDFMGILFYVFGLLIGLFFKSVLMIGKFVWTALYTAFKRDQFNRRLRVAVQKTESELEPKTRALGREELRYLAATLGLTNAAWHQSIKLRRRMSEAVTRAGAGAVERNELNPLEAGDWMEQMNRLLFMNFDRSLLTAENQKTKRRSHRISRTTVLEKQEPVSENALEQVRPASKEVYTTGKLVIPHRSEESKSEMISMTASENHKLVLENFAPVTTTDWASDDEPRFEENH